MANMSNSPRSRALTFGDLVALAYDAAAKLPMDDATRARVVHDAIEQLVRVDASGVHWRTANVPEIPFADAA